MATVHVKVPDAAEIVCSLVDELRQPPKRQTNAYIRTTRPSNKSEKCVMNARDIVICSTAVICSTVIEGL